MLLLFCTVAACRQDQRELATVAHLPITLKEGYGPFYQAHGVLSKENPDSPLWGKIGVPVRGTPKHWTNSAKTMVWLDAHQLVYQNVRTGKISPENYTFLQKEWKWTPDTTKLVARPIKCYVYVITGFDERRTKWAAMVDTNNNLDFSDETAFYPEGIKPGALSDQLVDVHSVRYEVYRKGKIVEANVPMVVKMIGSEFVYNIPQYAVATFRRNDKNYELLISSKFLRTDFATSDIALSSSVSGTGKIDPSEITEIEGYIELGGVKYKNKGVDVFNNWLELEPVDGKVQAYSLQVGHPLYPFSANEFTSGKPISLTQYKGKYVYVDFWETGCKPCVQEMPALKQLYQRVDKNRFDIVGIVNDPPERLSRFLVKYKLTWPQILSDSTNKLIETYHITGYPTSVLVDPTGNVIAKDLRADGLIEKLTELKLMN